MYKLLLCWRYLRTKYIALASVISVTLGVATMIVVNGVMEGFTREMQDRIHAILSDVVVESYDLRGFYDAGAHMQRIHEVAGDKIAAMTPTVHVPAMLSFNYGGQWVTRPVQLIGIDETTKDLAGDFGKYLQHPENRRNFNFELRNGGYLTRDPAASPDANLPDRRDLEDAGWPWRRRWAAIDRDLAAESIRPTDPPITSTPAAPSSRGAGVDPPITRLPPTAEVGIESGTENGTTAVQIPAPANPFDLRPPSQDEENIFDPAREQHTGVVLGIALASYRDKRPAKDGSGEKVTERFLVRPGDDVKLTFPTAGTPPKAVDYSFTIVDFYESKMSEYDQSFVFVPIKELQRLRGMINPSTNVGFVTSIQIKLKDERDGNLVRDKLRDAFPEGLYGIQTWRDKQGPLLAAVQMETAILNVLLFLIIAVAGFGILAIFFMIVVEKTRDIGILKSLGASAGGVLGIFLSYGLSLGIVGSGAGLIGGLLFVTYINEIADLLGKITGHEVFSPEIYYFQKIPTIVEPWTVSWIVVGALIIAVLASVLPAMRAAKLHPVEALRYE